MKNLCWLLFACLPYIVVAQEVKNDGIKWENELTWQQVKQKAKQENKFIFVDCYATWCGPCKVMHKNIYLQDSVIEYMNANFISITLQMDTTAKDDAVVKSWYSTANALKNDYAVSSFPTLLFFSPFGNIVHKYVGIRGVQDMLVLASRSMDPKKQYYNQLKKYKAGHVDISDMPYFARSAKNIGEEELALQLAAVYTRQYVNILPTDSLFSETVLSFLRDFPNHFRSSDKIVRLCYEQPGKVNQVMYDGFDKNVIKYFIGTEYIAPALKAANTSKKDPDWNKLFTKIKSRFGEEHASNTLLSEKLKYYKNKKDWKRYTVSIIEKVDKQGLAAFNGIGGALDLNNYAWEIFSYSNSKKDLNKALKWSEHSLTLTGANAEDMAGHMDTQANLLFKLGKKREALALQEKAVLMSPEDKAIRLNLVKMKKDEPTWVVDK